MAMSKNFRSELRRQLCCCKKIDDDDDDDMNVTPGIEVTVDDEDAKERALPTIEEWRLTKNERKQYIVQALSWMI